MHHTNRITFALALAVSLSACVTTSQTTTTTPTEQRTTRPGMDDKGNVLDSKLIEAGSGRQIKGMNDQTGEIVGNPAQNSKFNKLKIGMPMQQVIDLIGEPNDSGAYVTGKAWIPFYFGQDRYRYETVYEKTGRLIFAGGGMDSKSHLIWIIHNRTESRYR